MKAMIVDIFWLGSSGKHGKFKVIDPEFLPRIGETVRWLYEPAPRVKQVIWDFDGEFLKDLLGDPSTPTVVIVVE
jgi:hypothetical protein